MKTLVLVILTIVICGCKSVDLSRGDFAPPYTASIGELEPELVITEGSILHQDIVQWIRENQAGWERSMITYAPNVMIRNDNMNLNFGDGGVILNFNVNPKKDKWIQIKKDCNIKDLKFINKIKLKLRKNKEVKLLGPKNGILYETSIEGTVHL